VFTDIYYGKEHDWNFEVAPETILDAGAYTGLSTAYFAARYPGAKIIAIEPSEENFALLIRNVSKLENVHAINAALWGESGSLVLTDPGRGYWGLTVEESDTGTSPDQKNSLVPPSKVDALTVADLMSDCEVDRVNLLKLDIEGSEKEVFSNALPWIDRVDAIFVELHDRFKPGCARAFFGAVTDFPVELRRGEKILVIRDASPMGLVVEQLTRSRYWVCERARGGVGSPSGRGEALRSFEQPVDVDLLAADVRGVPRAADQQGVDQRPAERLQVRAQRGVVGQIPRCASLRRSRIWVSRAAAAPRRSASASKAPSSPSAMPGR
jgi:FkbM family methyltransferase